MSTITPPAFAISAPLPKLSRSAPSLRSKPPRCSASAPRRAKLFSNGERLLLHQAPPPTESTPRYILCPSCNAAYVGNAVTSRIRVSCPSCSEVFHTSPADLYVPAPPKPLVPAHPNAVVCPHISLCSGCTVTADASAPPILSEALDFLTRHLPRGTTPTSHMGPPNAWRTHAKLAIRRTKREGRTALGLFRAGTHDLLPIPKCGVHAPEITVVAALIEDVLRAGDVTPYNEMTGRGYARYVLLSVQRSTRRVQVTLVWNASSWKDGTPLAAEVGRELWRRGGKLLHSLWFNWNTTTGNAIVNPERERYYHVAGTEALVETVCDVEFTFPPYVFRQANLDAFENLVLPQLLEYIPRGACVVELCAGVGIIGLVALKHRKLLSLCASELHGGAEGEFWGAVKKLRKKGITAEEIEFEVGSDDETLELINPNTEIVIVDPPRSGLTPEVVERLAVPDEDMSGLRRIIYVSCGFSAFKRNSRTLCADGEWKIVAAHTFVLFPGSDQLETLAIFDRMAYKKDKSRNGRDGVHGDESPRRPRTSKSGHRKR